MTELLRVVRDGGGLELVLDPGPASAFAVSQQEVRAALDRALTEPAPQARFILLRGAMASAFAGPVLPEASQAKAPTLIEICARIEACAIPVGILLEGPVDGDGAALALAAHHRLATPAARLSFSALSSGRLPRAGASVRLARLVGAGQALRLLRSGAPVSAAEALALGIVDEVCDVADEVTLLGEARSRMAALHRPRPSLSRDVGLRDGRDYLRAIAEARKGLAPDPVPAEPAMINCVEAAMLLPASQALDFDATLAEEVDDSEAASALTHVLRAEGRAAQVPPGLAGFDAAPVRSLGIAGAEPALIGIVLTALSRGLAVTLCDPSRERLVAFLETVAARQEAAVKSGKLTANQRDADWARLSPAIDVSGLAGAEMILAGSAAGLPQVPKTRPLLVMGRGDLPAGAFRLVLSGRIAEVGLPSSSPGPLVLSVWSFLRRMGLTVVLTGQQAVSGISGRLSAAGGAAVRAMAEMGVPGDDIRAALTAFGVPAPKVPDAGLVAPRTMPAAEITDRWLAALANEGARLMQAGVTQSALDIDLVAVTGLAFPRRRGGPMHQADRRGVILLRRDLGTWAGDAAIWAPVAALDSLASLGRGFAGAVRPG